MPPSDVQRALAQVISEMLAEGRFYFGASGPEYIGLEVSNLSSDGSEFDLALTFKAGIRYCCIEWGCHIALYSSGWFQAVKDRLGAKGITNLPLMTVRNLHVLVEKGAISDGPGNIPCRHESVLEYDVGPFHEVGRTEEEQTGS
jgi:hypothetical protein